jgi:hypothetical protein
VSLGSRLGERGLFDWKERALLPKESCVNILEEVPRAALEF